MGKVEQLAKHRANVLQSMAPREASLPPGFDPAAAVTMPANLVGVFKDSDVAKIPVGRIEADPDQPRQEFEEEALGRLAESMQKRGQLQPIRVRWDEGRGVYVVLVGERRWRAARKAGLEMLSCVIHKGPLSAEDKLAVQLVENALREDLKPVEQAKAYKALMEARGCSTRDLAEDLHIEQVNVIRALALLKLPDAVQEQVDAGKISPSTGYEISKADPEAHETLADRVAVGGMPYKAVVEAVKQARPKPSRAKATAKPSKPRKVTSHTIRTPSGPRVTVEFGRGLTPALISVALAEALSAAEEVP